jgi:hypothetical protein
MAFILNRTDDRARMPKKRIIATAIVWYFIFLLINFAIILGVTCIYNKMGVEPGQLTKFVGDRSFHMDRPLWYISQLLLVAPVVEEIIFRLELSFKRQTVALWAGLLPVSIVGYLLDCSENWMLMAGMLLTGGALYWLVMRYTTDEQWKQWRSRYLHPAIWISALAFCFMHLRFTVLTWGLLPYCLAIILRPGLVGCILTYVRVNLGYWWGVLFHAANNTPAAIMMLLSMYGQ